MSGIGHNVDPTTAAQLRAFVERLERVEGEIRDLNDDKKDIYGEAKGFGYIPKIIKKVLAIRRQDRDQRIEEETILDTYLAALGMLDHPEGED